jgi:hypothetical protein
LFEAVLALLGLVLGYRARESAGKPASGRGVVLAILPASIMLVLFYSLAIHMRQSLGDWPSRIGEEGFSRALVVHGTVTISFFMVLALANVFLFPALFVICLLKKFTHTFLFYLGAYGVSCMLCFGAMLLAPAAFLNWWWD